MADEQTAAFTECSQGERIRRTQGLAGLAWYRYQLLDKALLSAADESMIDAEARRLLFGTLAKEGT
jgi:hypothetical protein